MAVHLNNPQDIPGRVTLEFENQSQCQQSLRSMTYWLKFSNFKVEGQCVKKPS
jgi:hypothetical protein